MNSAATVFPLPLDNRGNHQLILMRLRKMLERALKRPAKKNNVDILDRVRASSGLNALNRLRSIHHWTGKASDIQRAEFQKDLEALFKRERRWWNESDDAAGYRMDFKKDLEYLKPSTAKAYGIPTYEPTRADVAHAYDAIVLPGAKESTASKESFDQFESEGAARRGISMDPIHYETPDEQKIIDEAFSIVDSIDKFLGEQQQKHDMAQLDELLDVIEQEYFAGPHGAMTSPTPV